MSIRTARFVALFFCVFTLSLTFCHLMEMPARMRWDQGLWVGATVRGGEFFMFGTVGAALEVGAVLATLVLAVLCWRAGGAARWLALAAFVLFALSLADWWWRVFPANQVLATWVDNPPPADWEVWRNRWEIGHASSAGLQIAGFLALAWSIIRETPSRLEQVTYRRPERG